MNSNLHKKVITSLIQDKNLDLASDLFQELYTKNLEKSDKTHLHIFRDYLVCNEDQLEQFILNYWKLKDLYTSLTLEMNELKDCIDKLGENIKDLSKSYSEPQYLIIREDYQPDKKEK